MFGWFKRNKREKRAASGFTAEVIAARESYISGQRGIAELTATAQSCVSLWENGFSIADVKGTDLLDPLTMALLGRSLGLRGEAVFLISETGLVPAMDWDLTTRDAKPRAYRLSVPETAGARTLTALAAEVLHIRIGVDPAAPYYGSAPLRRSMLTAGMLNELETALSEVFANAPLGSQIVPYPEATDTDMTQLGRDFRSRRGRVMLRESVMVSAAGGPAPNTDWRPSDVSPDLSKSMTREHLAQARDGILGAFGVLPGLFNAATTGPLVREAQRHLAQWTLQPIAFLLAQEATEKLSADITVDTMRPLQAYDAGGRARALMGIVQTLAMANEAGVDPQALQNALKLVDWHQAPDEAA